MVFYKKNYFISFLLEIAAFLDPTTYCVLTDDEISTAEQIIMAELNTRYSADSQSQTSTQSSDKTGSSHARSGHKSLIGKLFNMCNMPELRTISTNNSKQLSFKEEICHYMSTIRTVPSGTTFSQYWCQNEMFLPNLSKLAKYYSCIPCTSVPSESAFSVAGYIQRKNRMALSSTALRYSMVLRK